MTTNQKIAIAKILSSSAIFLRKIAGKGKTGTFSRNGCQWELDLTQGIDFAIYLQGNFEPETTRFYQSMVSEGMAVLDIGANIGAHTLPLAKSVGKTGKVFAFEPTDYAFQKLQRNLELNPQLKTRVSASQVLLTSPNPTTKPSAIPSSWPLCKAPGELHPLHSGTFNSLDNAKPYTLDQWASENQLPPIDFVKLDVDGFEIDILEGATKTFQRKPKLLMEFAPYIFKERGRSFQELINILTQLQYKCQTLAGKPIPLSQQLEKEIPEGGSINVILS